MTPERQDRLTNRFPMIFASRYMDMTRTAMCWGFECGDGWYHLIYLTCLGIEEEYKKNTPLYLRLYHLACFHLIPRWNRLISKQPEWMYTTVGQDKWKRRVKRFYVHMPHWLFQATQIKEKYGTLRFYMNGNYLAEKYADMAEDLSSSTCEICGEYGELRGTRWLYTACDKHTNEEDRDKESDVT